MVSIDERPVVMEQLSRIGDWELNTIIDMKHSRALISSADRKSRLTLIARLSNKSNALAQAKG